MDILKDAPTFKTESLAKRYLAEHFISVSNSKIYDFTTEPKVTLLHHWGLKGLTNFKLQSMAAAIERKTESEVIYKKINEAQRELEKLEENLIKKYSL